MINEFQDAEHVLSKCMADYDSETGHDTDTDTTSNHVSQILVKSFVF